MIYLTKQERILVASIAHTLNELWRHAHGEYPQGEWDKLPPEKQDKTFNGVDKCVDLFNIAGGEPNSDTLAIAMHENWSVWMASNGWKYGATQDETAKTHPCLLPYDRLPAHQQRKDTFIPIALLLVVNADVHAETD